MARVMVLVATRKGAWLYRGDASRRAWKVDGPHFLGHVIHHLVLDPRDRRTLLAAAKTGHLGPTVFRSTDLGRTWKEARARPRSRRASRGRAVDHAFWLTPGHASEPGTWYAGTSPQGLFRSDDGGVTWEPLPLGQRRPAVPGVDGRGAGRDARRPEAALDPRRPARSRRTSTSACRAGASTSLATAGKTFAPLVAGMEVVEGFDAANVTFHDPHCVRALPERPGPALPAEPLRHLPHRPAVQRRGSAIGRSMPKQVGRHRLHDGGPPARPGHRLGAARWTARRVWPRTSPGGKPSVHVTRNGGRTWQRLDSGLPAQPGVVDGQAAGHVRRPRRAGRPLLRHDERRAVGEPRRGRAAGPASRGTCPRSTPSRRPTCARRRR